MAIIVAFALIGLVVLVAAAIDLGRAYLIRSDLQIAVDSAAKAAAADALEQPLGITEAEKKARAKATVTAFFKANYNIAPELLVFNPNDPNDLEVDYVSTGENEDSIIITAKGKVQLAFARLLVPEIPITVGGRVKRPRPAPLELALVLDVTQSMNQLLSGGSSKMVELKKAATGLTDYVLDSDYAKVGIVPFGQLVNIGPVSASSWLEVEESERICDRPPCTTTCNGTKWGSCGGADEESYPCLVPNCSTSCTGCRTSSFIGCMGLRDNDNNDTNTFQPNPTIASPGNPKYYGARRGCDTPLMTDLTAKADRNAGGKTYIRNQINALPVMGNPNTGSTYIPIGLMWGWNMLDPAEPLTLAGTERDPDKLRKSIVLLTDGENYWKQTDKKGNGRKVRSDPGTNDLTLQICSNIRASDIKISTVALAIDSSDTLDMLKACASSPADYYKVETAQELQNAFKRIGMAFSYNSLKE